MNLWLQKLIAKLVVVPAMFSFVFTCCHPISVQAAEIPNDMRQNYVQLVNYSSDLKIQDVYHCDHEKKTQTQTIQAPTQKITADLFLFSAQSSPIFAHTDPKIDLAFAVRAPITGPPWFGKNIKGFLGVYRS